MTNPRFRPARYTTEPKLFGRARVIEWKAPGEHELVQLVAAQLQHDLAFQIRERLNFGTLTIRDYATNAEISYQRLTRILRGTELMRIEDIATAMIHLDLNPTIRDRRPRDRT